MSTERSFPFFGINPLKSIQNPSCSTEVFNGNVVFLNRVRYDVKDVGDFNGRSKKWKIPTNGFYLLISDRLRTNFSGSARSSYSSLNWDNFVNWSGAGKYWNLEEFENYKIFADILKYRSRTLEMEGTYLLSLSFGVINIKVRQEGKVNHKVCGICTILVN